MNPPPLLAAAAAGGWRWRVREAQEPPRAAVAWGREVSRQLLQRLGRLPATQQASLSATAGGELLVVTGEAAELPWVDGVAYAAPCAEAPQLWLPLLSEPELPADLIARALQQRFGRAPLLLWPAPLAVVPLDRQLPLGPALLARVAEQWRQPR